MEGKAKIIWDECIHGNLKKDVCKECEEALARLKDFNFRAMAEDIIKERETTIPITRKCPNAGSPCFCTGICQEVIGRVQIS